MWSVFDALWQPVIHRRHISLFLKARLPHEIRRHLAAARPKPGVGRRINDYVPSNKVKESIFPVTDDHVSDRAAETQHGGDGGDAGGNNEGELEKERAFQWNQYGLLLSAPNAKPQQFLITCTCQVFKRQYSRCRGYPVIVWWRLLPQTTVQQVFPLLRYSIAPFELIKLLKKYIAYRIYRHVHMLSAQHVVVF